jgi:hypothetical protein
MCRVLRLDEKNKTHLNKSLFRCGSSHLRRGRSGGDGLDLFFGKARRDTIGNGVDRKSMSFTDPDGDLKGQLGRPSN